MKKKFGHEVVTETGEDGKNRDDQNLIVVVLDVALGNDDEIQKDTGNKAITE